MVNSENISLLWQTFSEGLRSFIMSKVKNDADTEDILQNVFIRVHDNIGTLSDRSKIKPWLYQVTRNLIVDHFRKKRFDQIDFKNYTVVERSSVKFMDEAVSDMVKMMDDLPPEYCEALCQTEIGGMSQKEYAEKAGLSYSGAKSRVQRARIMLKQMLLECCHYQFDKYGTVFNIEPGCCHCSPPSRKC